MPVIRDEGGRWAKAVHAYLAEVYSDPWFVPNSIWDEPRPRPWQPHLCFPC